MDIKIKDLLEKYKTDKRIHSYAFDYHSSDIYVRLDDKIELVLDHDKLLGYKHIEDAFCAMVNNRINERLYSLVDLSKNFNRKG